MPQANKAGTAGSRKNNKYTPQFKLDRALEALRTDNVAAIARRYDLNANLLYYSYLKFNGFISVFCHSRGELPATHLIIKFQN